MQLRVWLFGCAVLVAANVALCHWTQSEKKSKLQEFSKVSSLYGKYRPAKGLENAIILT